MILISLSTLVTIPNLNKILPKSDVWHNKSLQFLQFSNENRYVLHQSDLLTNQAAAYIDSITENWEPVMVLCENQMLNYNSHTRPYGDRYQYLFYLLRSDLIDRKTFDRLMPPKIMKDLFADPPKVIATVQYNSPLIKHVPEFESLLKSHYTAPKQFGQILVYEKK